MPINESLTVFIRKHVAKRLAARRAALGLTLREVAERAGVSDTMVHAYETGDSDYPLAGLLQLCTALEMALDDAIGDLTQIATLKLLRRKAEVSDTPAKQEVKRIMAGAADKHLGAPRKRR